MTLNKKFICIDYLFRGKENRVTCFVDGVNALKIEIEDKLTNNEWMGTFTCEYIEELTKKTGNFKSYDVFVSMLQTVLTENAGSLSLDLMTYSDLEELRKLKMGPLGKGSNITNSDAGRQNKRYLILTYTTDFDKIHYPLPLLFQGTSDVQKLKDVIIDLRQQIYNSIKGSSDYERYEIAELNKRILKLQNENDHIVSSLEKYKTHFQNNDSIEDLKKELKAVKALVRSLEEDLAEEKSKHQRILLRKNRESKSLTDEMLELKASKRNLDFKVHSLTNELAIYKRQRTMNGVTSPRPPIGPSPKSSFDMFSSSSKTLSRALKNSISSPLMFSDPETNRITRTSRRPTSLSSTNRLPSTSRRCSSAERYRHGSMISSKFDPTAYIEEQKIRKLEVSEKRKREIRSRIQSGNFSDHSRGSSPASFRDLKSKKLQSQKFIHLSSSNISSMSDIDEKVSTSRSKNSVRLMNRHRFDIVTENKHRPTPLNDTDDVSENDSIKPNAKKLVKKKCSNGFKSDESSIIGDEEFDERRTIRKKQARAFILDSGDNEIGPRPSCHSKISRKVSHRSNSTLKTPRVQQSNNNYLSYNNQSSDINDIDQRLNALQDFFKKYLHTE